MLDGDSITANMGETTVIANRYGNLGLASMQGVSTYAYANVAVGGQTCLQRTTAYPTDVRPRFNPASKFKVASLLCGINDRVGGADEATVYARILAWVALAIADGFTPVVWTVEDNGIMSDGYRATLNGLITAGAAGNGYTVADIAANATMGCNGCDANTTYFIDGTHPTVAGNAIFGTVLKTTLESLGWN